MSTYAWIITADLINEDLGPQYNRVGVTGPRDATDEQLAQLQAGEGHVFRMLDSDGNEYYAGRFLGDRNSEDAFGPLDDFGRPDAGATEIQYLGPVEHAAQWVTL
jgi:hypothetical protein